MSRWEKNEWDDRPMTDEEFLEYRAELNREMRRLRQTGFDWRKLPLGQPTRKASRRDIRYLEKLEEQRNLESLFDVLPVVEPGVVGPK